MQRIISVILSILLMFFGVFVPGATEEAVEPITQGEWLSMINSEFGMTSYESDEAYYPNVTPENEYFAAVQIAYEWGVIDSEDDIDVDANVTTEFAAKTLVSVANLEAVEDDVVIKNADDLKYAEEVAILVANGFMSLKANGKFDVSDIDYEKAVDLLAKVKEYWANQDFSDNTESVVNYDQAVNEISTNDYVIEDNIVTLPADVKVAEGETIVLPQNDENIEGAILNVESVKTEGDKTVIEATPADAEKVIDSVKFEGEITPNLAAAQITDAQGNVVQTANVDNEGALGDLIASALSNISFNIGPVNVKAAIRDNGFEIGVSGYVYEGINLSNTFSVSNLNVQAKLDASVLKQDVKEAYVVLDYDAVNTTAVTGAQTWGLVSENTEDVSDLGIIDQIKANFSNLKLQAGALSNINVFTVAIPIPNCPEIVISLDVSLQISVYGRVELVISSHNYTGYEVVNNKGRFINQSTDKSYGINAYGSAEVSGCISLGIGILTYDIIDVAVNGGIGAAVYTSITLPCKGIDPVKVTEELPADMVAEALAVLDDADEFDICGQADFYGILRISVGQNSLIGKLGLSKSWSIFDRNNGTFATITF
ncbi:MAG: hypothetical protein IIX39_01420 [Clostridia bacterium]|nr:hypothetical protein [Clostridia bacterium]